MLDDDTLHAECNNPACCHDGGAIVAHMLSALASAIVGAMQLGPGVTYHGDAAAALEPVCEGVRDAGGSLTGADDPDQAMLREMACGMRANALTEGVGLFGVAEDFVTPLDWAAYEPLLDGYVAELAAYEADLAVAETQLLVLQQGQQLSDELDALGERMDANFDALEARVDEVSEQVEAARDDVATNHRLLLSTRALVETTYDAVISEAKTTRDIILDDLDDIAQQVGRVRPTWRPSNARRRAPTAGTPTAMIASQRARRVTSWPRCS